MNRNFVRSTLDVDHRTSAYQCGKTDIADAKAKIDTYTCKKIGALT